MTEDTSPQVVSPLRELAGGLFISLFLAYLFLRVVTPLFGFDPIGDYFDTHRGEIPWAFVGINVVLLGSVVWMDWSKYKQDGDVDAFAQALLKSCALAGLFALGVAIGTVI